MVSGIKWQLPNLNVQVCCCIPCDTSHRQWKILLSSLILGKTLLEWSLVYKKCTTVYTYRSEPSVALPPLSKMSFRNCIVNASLCPLPSLRRPSAWMVIYGIQYICIDKAKILKMFVVFFPFIHVWIQLKHSFKKIQLAKEKFTCLANWLKKISIG